MEIEQIENGIISEWDRLNVWYTADDVTDLEDLNDVELRVILSELLIKDI